MIRVVVVDDQELIREGIRVLLDRAADIDVAATAGDATTALAVIRAQRPDVVLMDIRMPGADGLAATRRIVADPELRQVRVVVLTTFDTDENILDAVRAGAAGFLLKDTDPGELRAAVRTVAGGEALLSPAVTHRVMRAAARGAGPSPRTAGMLDRLTRREREVLRAVAAGGSNLEIGAALHMSPATARTHIGRLLDKLQARDRAGLVAIAYETGLIVPGARPLPD